MLSNMDQEKSDLEKYLISIFSKVQDQYGQKLDILPALPTLVDILSDNSTTPSADKKLDFIGEAACQFAVRCVVARNFNSYDDRILDALAKKFRALNQINKFILREIQLKQHVKHKFPNTIIQTISGVLYAHFGIPAVEKFIENAVMDIASHELGEARVKLNIELNAISQFYELVCKEGGSMESKAVEIPGSQWQVNIVAKMKPTAITFSHARNASSKQKAKLAACQDILKFLSERKDVFDQLQDTNVNSTDIHSLPIELADYTKIQESVQATITTKSTTYHAADYKEDEHTRIPYTDGEDAIRLLSRLLLGETNSDEDSSMSEESPTKKRMRDVEQQVKQSQKSVTTGLESMFHSSSYPITAPTSPLKPEPFIKTDPDNAEAINQMMLRSLSSSSTTTAAVQSASSSSTAAPTQPTEMMEDVDEPTNPFDTTKPTISELQEQQPLDPRIISYYKKIFSDHRSAVIQSINMAGQCKSIFLSLVNLNTDKIVVESKTTQIGPSHAPVFSALVIMRSRQYVSCTIKTEAIAKRKKDAEMHAFHKLVSMLK